jgi:hypothetical protein
MCKEKTRRWTNAPEYRLTNVPMNNFFWTAWNAPPVNKVDGGCATAVKSESPSFAAASIGLLALSATRRMRSRRARRAR